MKAVIRAAQSASKEVVALLLEKRADVNAADSTGPSALGLRPGRDPLLKKKQSRARSCSYGPRMRHL